MSYLVLARKFRPDSFPTVVGQEHVTKALANAIRRDKISHAYLFCGPRGVGKTSVARVLAKALNCEEGPTATPCLKCKSCIGIAEGRDLAVREIDGASHNSVENVRDLIETLRSLPAGGARYKVYIIDEVHMLSSAAFNALLKSLEEPPPHTVFILATTEPHKVLDTVISRCQRYDFRALPIGVIRDQLQSIARKEGINADPEVFHMVAKLSDGSMRDAQSLLDRVQAFGDEKISVAVAAEALGVVERAVLSDISASVFSRKPEQCLELCAKVFASGIDPRLFLNDFATHWRDVLLAKFGSNEILASVGLTEEMLVELRRQVEAVSAADLQDLVQLAREGADAALRSAYPKYALEALLVRMASREPVKEIAALIDKIEQTGGAKSVRDLPAGNRPAGNLPTGNLPTGAVQSIHSPQPPPQQISRSVDTAPLKTKGSLDWRAFVQFVSSSDSPLLCEYIQRLGVEEFAPGVLKGSGNKMAVGYLTDQSNREKLTNLLNRFDSAGQWSIKLAVAEGAPAAASLHDEEKAREHSRKVEMFKDMGNHPVVASLKKAFPGSVLDRDSLSGAANEEEI